MAGITKVLKQDKPFPTLKPKSNRHRRAMQVDCIAIRDEENRDAWLAECQSMIDAVSDDPQIKQPSVKKGSLLVRRRKLVIRK